MKQFTQKHLLGIKDITVDDIELIFETADGFKTVINRPIKKVPSLRDVTIANIFFENSTRTRISFELAQKRLSADTVNFAANGSISFSARVLFGYNATTDSVYLRLISRASQPANAVTYYRYIVWGLDEGFYNSSWVGYDPTTYG